MRGERGLTLIELLISIVVFAAIVAVAYPAFIVANDSMATGTAKDQMERKGDRLLEEVLQFLRSGRILSMSDAPDPPAVTIVRPRRSVALDELSNDGAVPWRAEQETLRFRPVRTVREAEVREDLNGDGDRTDEFSLGILVIQDADGTRPISQTGFVMLALPDYRGDVDGDGVGDPLFDLADRNVDIRIRLLTEDPKGRRMDTSLRSSLRLKNVQR